MKKFWILLPLILLLTGCGVQETFETIDDVHAQPVDAPVQQITLTLPDDATIMVMESDVFGKLYMCDGYTVTVQTRQSGDLNATIKETTGFKQDALNVISTSKDGLNRHECVWTAVGETGDQVGRAVILDDGNYHYVVCIMADAAIAGDMSKTWQDILTSFSLSDTVA